MNTGLNKISDRLVHFFYNQLRSLAESRGQGSNGCELEGLGGGDDRLVGITDGDKENGSYGNPLPCKVENLYRDD